MYDENAAAADDIVLEDAFEEFE
jgi:hypothetical protein